MLSLSGHSWNPAATWAVEGKALTALQGSSPGAGNADSGRGAYSTCRLRPVAGRAGLGRPPGADASVLSGALLVSLGGPPTLSGLQDSSASRTSPVGECVWGGLSRWCWAGPWGRPLQVSASAVRPTSLPQSGLGALPEVPPLASGSRLSSEGCFPMDRLECASALSHVAGSPLTHLSASVPRAWPRVAAGSPLPAPTATANAAHPSQPKGPRPGWHSPPQAAVWSLLFQ